MRTLNIDSKWTGTVHYACDGCRRKRDFPVSGEIIDWMGQRKRLQNLGWVQTTVNGTTYDFCSEACMNRYLKRSSDKLKEVK